MHSSPGPPASALPSDRGSPIRSLLFIHGTGVRGAEYERALERVRAELRERLPELVVHPCCWGDPLGARLGCGGSSIPGMDLVRQIAGAVADDEEALWYLLYQDPVYELRLMALAPAGESEFVPGVLPPGQEVDHRVRVLPDAPGLKAVLEPLALWSTFSDTVAGVTELPEYREAIAVAEEPLGYLRQAVARAVVAELVRRQLDEPGGGVVLAGHTRDLLVDRIAAVLGPSERGVVGWIGRQVAGVALGLGTTYIQRRRDLLFRAAYPFPGDILLYQARGARIRAFVRDCLKNLEPPVAVLGHSLGGIIAVDLLIAEAHPGVERLITVGSQAPFLYEMDALCSLPAGEPLPGHFPDWLNVYDSRDLLGFVAAGPFVGRARDVRVDNGQPFPASHGAYWDNGQVWSAIAEHLRP